jgi:hypothetical protein
LFRRFLLTQVEFWHETDAIGSSMKLCFQPYIERPKPTPYATWASVLLRTAPGLRTGPELKLLWPPPRGLEPDQPWTSFLTWKTLLDSIFSNPCTIHGHKHGFLVRISVASEPLYWILLRVVIGDPRGLNFSGRSRLRSRAEKAGKPSFSAAVEGFLCRISSILRRAFVTPQVFNYRH